MPTGFGTINLKFDRWTVGLRDKLEAGMVRVMLELETEAKTNHPYTDRTGDNTASIRGFVSSVLDTEMVGILSASMQYSAFLEAMKGGKFAYLWPAVERKKPEIMRILTESAR